MRTDTPDRCFTLAFTDAASVVIFTDEMVVGVREARKFNVFVRGIGAYQYCEICDGFCCMVC